MNNIHVKFYSNIGIFYCIITEKGQKRPKLVIIVQSVNILITIGGNCENRSKPCQKWLIVVKMGQMLDHICFNPV